MLLVFHPVLLHPLELFQVHDEQRSRRVKLPPEFIYIDEWVIYSLGQLLLSLVEYAILSQI